MRESGGARHDRIKTPHDRARPHDFAGPQLRGRVPWEFYGPSFAIQDGRRNAREAASAPGGRVVAQDTRPGSTGAAPRPARGAPSRAAAAAARAQGSAEGAARGVGVKSSGVPTNLGEGPTREATFTGVPDGGVIEAARRADAARPPPPVLMPCRWQAGPPLAAEPLVNPVESPSMCRPAATAASADRCGPSTPRTRTSARRPGNLFTIPP